MLRPNAEKWLVARLRIDGKVPPLSARSMVYRTAANNAMDEVANQTNLRIYQELNVASTHGRQCEIAEVGENNLGRTVKFSWPEQLDSYGLFALGNTVAAIVVLGGQSTTPGAVAVASATAPVVSHITLHPVRSQLLRQLPPVVFLITDKVC